MKKRICSLLLALVLVLTLFPAPVRAEGSPAIVCGDGTAAQGRWVNIPIRAENLEALAALELELYYDPEYLSYESCELAPLMDGAVSHINGDTEGVISFSAVSADGITGSGSLMNLRFYVAADCPPGDYPLTLAVGEAYDTALSPVTLAAHSGKLTVTERVSTNGTFGLGLSMSAESLYAGEILTAAVQNRLGNGFAGLDLTFSYDPALFELVRAEASESIRNAVYSLNTDTQGLVRLTCAASQNLWCRELLTVELRARETATGSSAITAEAAEIYDDSLIPYEPGSAQAQVTILEADQTVTPALRMESQQMVMGAEAATTVILGEGSHLAAADFRLEYDPALLSCLSVESAVTEGYLVINPNFADGTIRFSYVNEGGAESETPLVTIRWQPTDTAGSHYTVKTTLIDPVDPSHNRVELQHPDHSGCIYREENTEATCTQPGGSALVCVGCGDRIPLNPTPALGHDYGAPAFTWSENHESCTAVRVCDRNGSHIWQVSCAVASVSTDGSCTEPGSVTYTAMADFGGEIYTDVVTISLDALGHAYTWTTVTEPGCTAEGLRRGECIRCGSTTEEVLDPLGHDWSGTTCTRCGQVRENPFTDVPDDSFYYEPVIWAVSKGITNGTSATTFGPGDSCMRAHVVTFLWRAAGSPEPASSNNPFTDVKETDFYFKAVLWAVENGITNGLDATHFGPFAYCNRAQVVTFLHRALHSPAPSTSENPFTDVPAGQWYTTPVLWAVENGITNGLSPTTFGPTSICNRAQIVTFLYRAFNDS